MCTTLKFHKVATLPVTAENNAIYFKKGGGDSYADLHVSNTAGTLIPVVTSQRINELITASINPELKIYPDIPARDAATLNQNTLVVVKDASGDPTVDSGTAMYIWDNAQGAFEKLTEFESLDININWTDIDGRPTSTPAEIDAAVAGCAANTNELDNNVVKVTGDQNVGGVKTFTSPVKLQGGFPVAPEDATSKDYVDTQVGDVVADVVNLQADSHTHPNKTVLDAISDDGSGCLLYSGDVISYWSTADW